MKTKKIILTYFQVKTALALGYISPLHSKIKKEFETFKIEKKTILENANMLFSQTISDPKILVGKKIRRNATDKIKTLLNNAKKIVCKTIDTNFMDEKVEYETNAYDVLVFIANHKEDKKLDIRLTSNENNIPVEMTVSANCFDNSYRIQF